MMIPKLLLVLSFVMYCLFPVNHDSGKVQSFQKMLSHPGLKDEGQQLLSFEIDKETFQVSSKVASVMCYTNQCKIITVTLVWDRYGNFLKVDIPKGQSLEKHVDGQTLAFTVKDYKRLSRILKNDISKLGELTYNDLQVDEEDLDGYSGATRAFIGEKDVVKGATLTCFTLWHWANHPEIKEEIRSQNRKLLTETSSKELLASGEKDAQLFVLESLKLSGECIDVYWNDYIQKANELTNHEMLLLLQLTNDSQRQELLQRLTNVTLRTTVLNYIFSEDDYNENWLEGIHFNSYQEVSKLTDYLSRNKIDTPNTTSFLVPKLNAENVLISRSIYWYLKSVSLSKQDQKVLKKYEKKHKKNL
ncbi:hypothetical protein [Flammeovirga agarivorans]|uniref:Uncharacterized protein n=1 Tax=Flammeovirga agarivorans TaxID=2726742 RepID=A0A7X8SNI8_9BACT|nr:hypothetical protein [Flammeovirga agarivorans]NLR93432.1 hypothetical protein [Flammeovirga agarivorans]